MGRIRTGKAISLLLSLAIVIGIMPITAFAQTLSESSVELPTIQGGEQTENVTITVTTDEEGNTTASTKPGGFETESGLNVNYESSTVTNGNSTPVSDESHYTVSNSSGTYGAEGGSETKTGVTGDGSAGDITIGIIRDGEKAETEGSVEGSFKGSTTVPTQEGDHLKSEDPANFDQTTIATETERTATVAVEKTEVNIGDPIFVDTEGNPILLEGKDGYYYQYAGSYGEHWYGCSSTPGADISVKIVDQDGNTVEDYQGFLSISQMFVKYSPSTPDSTENSTENEILIDGLYCVDIDTAPDSEYYYRKVNLEDAVEEGYYSEEDASHLRAIMNSGYVHYLAEDDSEEAKAKKDAIDEDNLKTFKSNLIATLGESTLSDAEKRSVKDAIESLGCNEASDATQIAIWTYGNRTSDGNKLVITTKYENINIVAAYLASLTDDGKNEVGTNKETQIINQEKFVDDMDIIIGSMVKGHENNEDNNNENDVYDVSLKFSLVVQPSDKNDDLIVKVLDANGNTVKKARIAGNGTNDKDFGKASTVTDPESGKTYYILEGLQLAENSDVSFNLKLEGTQYLEEGVYVFKSEMIEDDGGNKVSSSQNLIGRFSGTAEVDVSMSITMSFDVKEGTVSTTREWRSEWTNSGNPDSKPTTPSEETPPKNPTDPELEIPDGNVPLGSQTGDSVSGTPNDQVLEIPDAELPSAEIPASNVPRTGDDSGLWLGLTALCACGLAALALTGRKREQA